MGTNVIIRDDVPEYWSSYYDSSVNHIADENVKVYIMKIVNDELQLELVSDRIINKLLCLQHEKLPLSAGGALEKVSL